MLGIKTYISVRKDLRGIQKIFRGVRKVFCGFEKIEVTGKKTF